MPGSAKRFVREEDEFYDTEKTAESRIVDAEACTVWRGTKIETCLTDETIVVELIRPSYREEFSDRKREAQVPSLFGVPGDRRIMAPPTLVPLNGAPPGTAAPN